MCTNPKTAWILDFRKYRDSFNYVVDKNYLSSRFESLLLSRYYQRKLIWNITLIPKQYHFLLNDVEIPCGKCDECLLKHAQMWSLRCQHEAMYHTQMCFLTLTYDALHVPRNNGVNTVFYPDIQLFFKRLRSDLSYKYGKNAPKIRYFVCTEYGGKTYRPHFHVILYGFCPKDAFDMKYFWKYGKSGLPVFRSNYFEGLWNRGFVFLGSVTKFACGYVARYTLEKSKHLHTPDFYNDRFKEKISMSRRDGIGIQWIVDNYKNVLLKGYITAPDNPSLKYGIPRAYLNKIQCVDSSFYWKEFHPIKLRKFYLYRDLIKQNYNCSDDYVNKYKHNAQYKKEVVKKLQRTLNDDDFYIFDNMPLKLIC